MGVSLITWQHENQRSYLFPSLNFKVQFRNKTLRCGTSLLRDDLA